MLNIQLAPVATRSNHVKARSCLLFSIVINYSFSYMDHCKTFYSQILSMVSKFCLLFFS